MSIRVISRSEFTPSGFTRQKRFAFVGPSSTNISSAARNIRNFVIISHVDHGKSTLADRLLELTGTVPQEKLVPQFLDRMPLERERGITIKMQPVRMAYHSNGTPSEFILNLIDTPGHSDFSYEVSRGLAAVEGAVLLVDATKGVQAQTLANFELAQAQGLAIIPAVNKIDLPTARIDATKEQLERILGIKKETALHISGKTGAGVPELLHEIVERIPAAEELSEGALQALIFDSHYDPHKGIVAHVRVFGGTLKKDDAMRFFHSGAETKIVEVGVFRPDLTPTEALTAGEIGYVATGLKDPALVRVGDTITKLKVKNEKLRINDVEPLSGYREPQPLVFASFYPANEEGFPRLKTALGRLHLNDAAFTFSEDHANTLGRGFRCGFLGTLHQEIVEERLKREYGQQLIVTQPSVVFEVEDARAEAKTIYRPSEFDRGEAKAIREPWLKLTILLPPERVGELMKLVPQYRALVKETESLGEHTIRVTVAMPLAEFFTGFASTLQSAVSGFASFSYEPLGMRPGDLVRFDILVHGEAQEAFTQIMHRTSAERIARERVEKLKTLMPRGLFPVAIQAAINGTIVARETVPALRKDVTGYLYGGDFTRKAKLLKKQKRGKKLLAEKGSVRIPAAVFRAMAHL